jgi:phage FluMu protein Com
MLNKYLGPLLLALLLLILISGCSTVVPVTVKFPDAPDRIKIKCPQLKTLNEEAKLSDIAKTVTENYTTYYECAVKHDAWIEWYETQKIIFEKLNK